MFRKLVAALVALWWRCPRCFDPAVCALEMTAELHEFLEGVSSHEH